MSASEPRLAALQELIDNSWAKASPGARASWPPETRMSAAQAVAFLEGQRYCAVATVTGQGDPHLAPCAFLSLEDGSFWLPAVAQALRLRHLRRRPRLALVVGQGVGPEHQVVLARGPVVMIAVPEVPPAVLSRAEHKLGSTRWAGTWIHLVGERLLAYRGDAGAG